MAGAEEHDERPEGPWHQAWRRLRRHRIAVAGLVFVTFVALVATFASSIAPFDPEVQERWSGALPPGSRHLDLRNEIVLEGGAPPRALDVPEKVGRVLGDGREHVLAIDVLVEKTANLRVVVRDGKIADIKEGGKPWKQVEVGERDSLRVRDDGQDVGVASLATGDPVPAGFPATPVVMLVLVQRTGGERYTAEARYSAAGATTAVTRGGEAVQGELRIPAASILDARLDGAPITHLHLLGTDKAGRDTLSRVIYGGRISLLIGVVATIVSLFVGVLYGATAAFAGGRVDVFMMRVVDVLYALPYIFLVILLVVAYGRDIKVLFIALGLVQWLTPSRVVRGQVLSLKQRDFVEAAVTLGSGRWKILRTHLIPNTLGVVAVFTTLTIPAVILEESFLSFIGLSVMYEGRPLESWGALVDYGRQVALGGNGAFWWLLVCPAAAMSATLLSLNFLGDGLRDALDPRQKGRG